MMINGIWAQMRGLGAAVWGGGVRWVWMLCLLWGSVGHAVPVQVVHEAGQWRSYWHQLSEDKNVGGVLWRVQQGFEIREDFKIAPESYWEVASGQTVSWRNQLLNQLSERSYLFNLSSRNSTTKRPKLRNGRLEVEFREERLNIRLQMFCKYILLFK